MQRRPLLLGNWKLHHRIAEARAWAAAVRAARPAGWPDLDVGLAPPATALHALTAEGLGDVLALCGQDAYFEPQGAFTGALSAPLLADAGARWLLVGHSERRRLFGETDASAARRVQAALAASLMPVLCVGEQKEERDSGAGERVVAAQLGAMLAPLWACGAPFVVAYEPVWAIGGTVAGAADIARAHAAIRRQLTDALGAPYAGEIRIAYGGGVRPADVAALMQVEGVDGLLVGGASLLASSFLQLAEALQAARRGGGHS